MKMVMSIPIRMKTMIMCMLMTIIHMKAMIMLILITLIHIPMTPRR